MKSAAATAARGERHPPGYRLAVLSRVAAAALGGYALATTFSILLSKLLSIPRAHAVMTAVLLSFAIYTGAVIWVFAARSATRAWVGVMIPAAVCAALSWMISS